jgi:hypothetical protein
MATTSTTRSPQREEDTHVTVQGVGRALISQAVKKAPGLDKLPFGAIWLLWRWDKQRIAGLMKAAIRTGRHPAVWKWARRVVIHKPGKDRNTKLKA